MASSLTAPRIERADGASLAFNLAGLMMLAVFAALAAAYLVDANARSADLASGATRPAGIATSTIAGRELRIPEAWLRHADTHAAGFSNQVDLRTALNVEGLDHPVVVDATVLPRSRVRPGAVMLDAVYLHQFAPETLRGPPGLVGKPLRLNPGLPAEVVWYDPLAANPFVAKCQAAVAEAEAASCMRAVVLPSGVGAVYMFEERALGAWRALDMELARMMATIGAW